MTNPTMNTRAVVEAFFAKGAANDLGIVGLFADDIEFFIPGDPKHFLFAGLHKRGGAALVNVFKAMWASRVGGSGKIVSSKLIVEGEDAGWFGVGISHEMNETSRHSGKRFTLDTAIHFTVRNGKIVRIYAFEDMTRLAQDYGFLS